MIFKPSVANYTINIDSDIQTNNYQAVDSPCEVVGVMASAGGGAIFVRLYDSDNAEITPGNRRVAIAANAGESSSFTPCQPMKFTSGVYVVFEQGGTGQGGGELVLVVNK